MISAFGIEHGEIGKALRPRRIKKPTAAQLRTQGPPPGPSIGEKVRTGLNRIGEGHISLKGIGRATGSGLQSTGRFVERHPGAVGAGLVGGGGAGAYKVLSDMEPKKKKS